MTETECIKTIVEIVLRFEQFGKDDRLVVLGAIKGINRENSENNG